MSGADEAASSTSGEALNEAAGDSTALRKNDALSRKRIAARRLPRIFLNPSGADPLTDTPITDFSHEGSSGDPKRQRLLDIEARPGDHFTLSELSDSQSKSPLCCAEKDSAKGHRCWPEVNNTVVCGYQLVGAGKEFTAFHIEKKIVKMCQLIDNDQYRKLLAIKQRLNEAGKFWKYDDLKAMREFVLPSGTEVCLDESGRRYMFSSWQYGTLHSKVQSGKVNLCEREAIDLFSKIARGIAFCHACGIVVRDVKLRKFVFIDREMTQLRLRDVFDVYICTDISDDRLRDRHSCPAYVAPEILKDSVEYAGRPADIWALGVLLYVLVFGSYPFNDVTPQRLFYRILKAKFFMPPHIPISQTARSLIIGLLKKEPSERPTADQLLHIPLAVQELDESNVVPLRTTLPGWREISSFRSASVFGTISSSSSIEFTRQFVRLNRNDDQVVPSISSATRNAHRNLEIIRDIISDGLMGTTNDEAIGPDESPHSASGAMSETTP